MQKRVCVIGAGPSGLVMVKELAEEGHVPECFEKASSFGGAFSATGNEPSRVYDNMHLTISNRYMAFSDFPPADDDEYRFWTGREYTRYLERYVECFDLMRHIRLGASVTRVECLKTSAHAVTGWKVAVRLASGETVERLFDAVAVCTGNYQNHKRPPLDTSEFSGEIMHSSTYLDAQRFAGKKVVVVGMGETAADIVRDVSAVADSCHLVTKSCPQVVPRGTFCGYPADSFTGRDIYPNRSHTDSVLNWLLALLVLCFYYTPLCCLGFFGNSMKSENAQDPFGQPVKEGFMDWGTRGSPEAIRVITRWTERSGLTWHNKYAVKNATWIPQVISGKITTHIPGRVQRVHEDRVVLADGSTIHADAIIFCTGYQVCFPFLCDEAKPPDMNVRNLWLHAFVPNMGASIMYCGFARPATGAVPLCSELQARFFALLLSGKRTLPLDVASRASAGAKREADMFYNAPQATDCVTPMIFMDTLAEQIGCLITPLEMLRARGPYWFLFWNCGANLGARFRLKGPGAKPELTWRHLNATPLTKPPLIMLKSIVAKLLHFVGFPNDTMMAYRKLRIPDFDYKFYGDIFLTRGRYNTYTVPIVLYLFFISATLYWIL